MWKVMIFSPFAFCVRNNFDLSCPACMCLILLGDTTGDWQTDGAAILNTEKCEGTNIEGWRIFLSPGLICTLHLPACNWNASWMMGRKSTFAGNPAHWLPELKDCVGIESFCLWSFRATFPQTKIEFDTIPFFLKFKKTRKTTTHKDMKAML